jgi:hypothetical protein
VKAPTTAILALAIAALPAAGCGDDEDNGEPIPAESAAALERQLQSTENRFAAGGGACADITGNADPNTTAVENVIGSLPENVDPDVRDSLEESFDRLFQLVDEQCDEEAGQETQPEPVPPPETDTETTETIPPEEEGDDEGEEEEQPPPEEEVPPEEVPPEEVPPTDGGELPGQGGGGGAVVPGEDG